VRVEGDPTPGGLEDAARADGRSKHTFVLNLDAFAWETLTEQAATLNVPVEELIGFSVLYYLADLDSHRISRRLPGLRLFDRD
jgi:hypothetical protein